MKKKFFLGALIALLSLNFAVAQDYRTGIGLRLGPYYGLTVKHNLNQVNAVEGILSASFNEFFLVGTYQWHHDRVFDLQPMRFYYGIGPHIGSWGGGRYGVAHSGFLLGASGIVGLEYNFLDIPLNIALDWIPQFDIIERFGPRFHSIGLSVRYLIR